MQHLTDDVIYVGVNDENIRLFEAQYKVEDGMSYNSYVIIDERIAVLDSVDRGFGKEWLRNVRAALGERLPDYLVVHHMEPDHSANIDLFMNEFPTATVVATDKAFAMMKGFFGTAYEDRRLVVGDGFELPLGKHSLRFNTAPMVHWPEVAVSYDKESGFLFSADAFGKFGVVREGEPYADWAEEARRYYIGIVGKYGAQVQSLLKKLGGAEISAICPLHGPVLKENLGYYLDLYSLWSSYTPEKEGVVIACASIYGNTAKAALALKESLERRGVSTVLYDLTACDLSFTVADAFRYSALVLACSTYNGDVFPPMRELISKLTERNYKKRTVALMENGSWAPTAAKVMQGMLEGAKELTFTDSRVTVRSAVNADTLAAVEAMAEELAAKVGA